MKDNSKEGLSSFDENKNHAMETKEPAMSWLRSKATPAVCSGCLSTPAAQRRNNAARKKFRTSNSRLVSAHAATPGLKKHCFWCLYVVLLQVKTGYHWTPKPYLTWIWHCWWNIIYCCLLNSFSGTEWCKIVLCNMLMWICWCCSLQITGVF